MMKHLKPTPTSFYIARHIRLLSALFLIIIVSSTIFTSCTTAQDSQQDKAQLTIDASQVRATMSDVAFGANTAVWDNHLLDPEVPDLLHKAGLTLLRFPGGSTSDVYHWKTQTLSHGIAKASYISPNDTFDAFMGVVQKAGAQALITVNYGSNEAGTSGGDPAEAAAWVYYANVVKHYGIKYWEIGNEVYGNGFYGPKWEADLHAEKGPAAYASNVLQFARAMKAVDPSIKIGVSLTTPIVNNTRDQMANWDTTVLSMACSLIDFVDVHWYPRLRTSDSRSADAQLLASPTQMPNFIAQPRKAIIQSCGAHADAMQLFLGEVNTDISVRQKVGIVNALFLADVYMSWLENGGANATWWDVHNGIEMPGDHEPTVSSNTAYGDPGLLSNGTCAGSNQCERGPCSNELCEPAANTPFMPYYGLQMLTYFGRPGDQMVTATSHLDTLAIHAVKQANGQLALLLINKDPANSVRPMLSIVGYTYAAHAMVYTLTTKDSAIPNASSMDVHAVIQPDLPPYSLTTIILTPARIN
jgi:hypothetical protein